MTTKSTIFDYVTDLFGVDTTPQLPTGNGYAAQIAPSTVNTHYLDRSQSQTMAILLLGKHTDQQTLSDSLFAIEEIINQRSSYDHGIYNIEVATPPSPVGKQGEFFIWSCIVHVYFII